MIMKVFRTHKTEIKATRVPGSLVVEKSHLYVNTADFMLELLDVQISGKKRMEVKAFLNGFQAISSYQLG